MADRNKDENARVLAYIHQFVAPQAEAHAAEHARLGRVLADLEHSYKTLVERHTELQAKYALLERRLADIDARFTNIAGMWSRENHPGKQTENDNLHHDVAAEYEQFLQAEVFPFVISPTAAGKLLRPDLQAVTYGRLNAVLFGSTAPAPEHVRAILDEFGLDYAPQELNELCARAASLTDRAGKLGRNQRWDFEFTGRFDSGRQTRYAGSADGGDDEIVAFVVAPGYVVGDARVIVRQLVFTTHSPAPRPRPDASRSDSPRPETQQLRGQQAGPGYSPEGWQQRSDSGERLK